MLRCRVAASRHHVPPGTSVFTLWRSVLCIRSKAWLAARVSLRLARLPRTASSAQRSRRLRSTRAAAPVLLAHANVTESINIFRMDPKRRHPHGTLVLFVQAAVHVSSILFDRIDAAVDSAAIEA